MKERAARGIRTGIRMEKKREKTKKVMAIEFLKLMSYCQCYREIS
jgi:hypothetical protein